MKKLLLVTLTLILSLFNLSTSAQTATTVPGQQAALQQLHKIKLSVPGLTYQWEKPISHKSALLLEGGIGGGLAFMVGATGTNFSYLLVPVANAGLRNYYNLDRRFRKGKNINHSAADFISLELGVIGKSLKNLGVFNTRPGLNFIAAWGMQRNLSRKINFEWQAGIGVYCNSRTINVSPNLGIGFSLLPG